jgi:hypothetical protein
MSDATLCLSALFAFFGGILFNWVFARAWVADAREEADFWHGMYRKADERADRLHEMYAQRDKLHMVRGGKS